MSTAEIHTIDSAYMIEFGHVAGGFHVKDLSGDTVTHTYTPPYSSYTHYYTAYGVWRRTTGNGKWEFSRSKINPDYRPAIIRECGIPIEPEVKEYSSMMEAQMKEEARVNAGRRWHDAVQTLARQSKKEEVKGKMYLQLIDVMFFNWKTKTIDFHEYIVAKDNEEAFMIAAQKFGKYDSKVHLKHAHCILGFDEKVGLD